MTSTAAESTGDTSEHTGRCPYSYPFDRPSAMGVAREYREIQEHEAVGRVQMPSGDRAYLVTRYDDVRTVLSDPRFSRAATLAEGAPRLGPAPQNFPTLLNMDPPDHNRVRKMISGTFTSRRVAVLEPHVTGLVEQYLDEMIEAGPTADLVEMFASRLPVQVICELLGVPMSDREQFGAWSRAFLATTTAEYTAEQVQQAQGALFVYLTELIASKRANPQDDILSDLVVQNDAKGAISELELTFLGVSLLVAGHETTVNMIANGVFALMLDPAAAELLRSRPEIVDTAIEELLRLFGPGTEGLLRIAAEDVELSGVRIPAGSAVLPSLIAANRDENRYPGAEHLDLERKDVPHLSFSHGPHFCIGAALARAELRVSFNEILRRLPGLALAIPAADVPRPEGLLVNGVSSLPVTWDADAARAVPSRPLSESTRSTSGEAP
ncbi:cytochrome P450 [Rhodococcus sp. LW-XY12]|uniref:cytochrome P450 n=1 Tax=Rhodococcus sp. LW-XY12 TaxID=2856851 RepID=UPI00214AD096|nr:cytochrome P450 [Rhodococcus sp. LW-XY12]